jgi:hypothetical protein
VVSWLAKLLYITPKPLQHRITGIKTLKRFTAKGFSKKAGIYSDFYGNGNNGYNAYPARHSEYCETVNVAQKNFAGM